MDQMVDNEHHPVAEADERRIRIDHAQLKQNWRRQNFVCEIKNAHANYLMFEEYRKTGKVFDSHDLPKIEGKKPCLVVGSGSSLNEILPHLLEWHGDIVCSSSHLSTLTYYGKAPNYFVVVDPRSADAAGVNEFGHPKPEEAWADTVLVTHPGCPPSYIQRWPSKIALFGLQDSSEPYYVQTQRIAYDWIKGYFVPMADAVSCAVALALSLGYNPVYMIGVDYGGLRFDMKWWNNTAWVDKLGEGSDSSYWVKTKNGVMTDPIMMYMKRGALMAILTIMSLGAESGHTPSIWNIADPAKTSLWEIPHASWKAAWRNAADLRNPWDDATRKHFFETIEISLAQLDIYVAYVHNGLHPGVRIVQASTEESLRKQIVELNAGLIESKKQADAIVTLAKKPVKELVKNGTLLAPIGIPKAEYDRYDTSKIKWIEDMDGYLARAKWLREQAVSV